MDKKMPLLEPVFAARNQVVATRDVAYGVSRVAFVSAENFFQPVEFPLHSELAFDDGAVYYRIHSGIRSLGSLRKASILTKEDSPCIWGLDFGGGIRIPLYLLAPHQFARVSRAPDRKNKCGLDPEGEKLLFGS